MIRHEGTKTRRKAESEKGPSTKDTKFTKRKNEALPFLPQSVTHNPPRRHEDSKKQRNVLAETQSPQRKANPWVTATSRRERHVQVKGGRRRDGERVRRNARLLPCPFFNKKPGEKRV